MFNLIFSILPQTLIAEAEKNKLDGPLRLGRLVSIFPPKRNCENKLQLKIGRNG